MIITKIKRLRGKRSRYSVVFDTGHTLEVSDWTIGKFHFRTGDDLDERTCEKIQQFDSEATAKNIAVNYISYRPRSMKEVEDHLTKKGFSRPSAKNVAQHLQSIHLIDDAQFAHTFVLDRLNRKPTGQGLLKQQLMAKGISSLIIEKVLFELISQQSQQASALRAAKQKILASKYSMKKIDPDKRKRRVLDFLLRRGFSYDIAIKTIRSTMDA